MKNQKALLVLSMVCLNAYAGQGVTIITPHWSEPPKVYKPNPEVDQCLNSLDSISKKNKIPLFQAYYCEDSLFRNKLKTEYGLFDTCIQVVTSEEGKDKFVNNYDICFDDAVRRASQTVNFQSCVTAAKKFEMGRDRYRFCTNPESIALIQDQNFNSCFSYLRNNLDKYNTNFNFNYCKEQKAALNVNSSTFKGCVSALSKLGTSLPSSIKYCLNPNNQDQNTLNKLSLCTETMNKLTDGKGVKPCLGLNKEIDLISAANLSCVIDMSKEYLDKTYFADEQPEIAGRVLQNFLMSCDRKGGSDAKNPNSKFKSVKVVSYSKRVNGSSVGGLSAITYDKKTKSFISVSDDQGMSGPSRMFELNADTLDFTNVSFLKTSVEKKDMLSKFVGVQLHNIDAEGITLLPNDLFAVSSETFLPNSDTLIRLYQKDGKQKKEIPLPEKFIPYFQEKEIIEYTNIGPINAKPGEIIEPQTRKIKTKELVGGIQMNKGFEALTSVPGKMTILTANEYPLLQDDIQDYRVVRIVRINGDVKGNFTPDAEFAYELDKGAENGLVELAAIDDNRILTLERRYNPKKQKVTAKIYEINLSQAKNYIGVNSFQEEDRQAKIETVQKKLILDLDEIEKELPPGLRKIDNFEGMALGPKLPNGKYQLTLVTDNNFNPSQLTQILTLEIAL